MELGEKMKQARLAAGLSQRRLCGDTITRNMLSQIENGTARPSMDTLRILAGRLGKPVSYFLDEDVVASANQEVMARAREAYLAGDYRTAIRALEDYREPDGLFDAEYRLLHRATVLSLAEQAIRKKKDAYALECLEQLGTIREGYCAELLEKNRAMLLARLQPDKAQPDLDEELRILARAALAAGEYARCGHLLDGAKNRSTTDWNLLRGQAYEALREYEAAAECYHRAEENLGEQVYPRLEVCYRELGDFQRAYEYACRQREG